jgi:hypothetical protein
MLKWKRNGPGQMLSTDGRYWLVNHSHYTGRRSDTWNVLVKTDDGWEDCWDCNDAAIGLRAAKAAAEASAAKLIG